MDKNILDEYNNVKNNVGLFDFSIEGKIKVRGNGRINFINGLVSNDIENLKENNGIYAAFLDRIGKVLSDCIVYKFDDFLLINSSLIGKNNIIEKLKNEAVLGKAEVEDVSMKYGLFSLQGPKSAMLLGTIINDSIELKQQYNCIIKKIKINNNEMEIVITKNDRTNFDGYDIFVPAHYYKEFKTSIINKGKKYNLKIVNNETYNILRLEAKIPLYSVDFDEKNILPEVTERAISYEKGCFVGQEIVARVKNIGKGITAKRLMLLEVDSKEVPEKNTRIIKDNKEIGYITSAAFSPKLNRVVAFGFLNKGFYKEGTIVMINNNKSIIKTI